MNQEDMIDGAYLPSGELNAPYLLANAKVLLQNGEVPLAISLFRLLKDHPKYGHFAHYGLGKCFLAVREVEIAVKAFERAFALSRRPYIALALLEIMMDRKEYVRAEQSAFLFAKEFAEETRFIQQFRKLYQQAIDLQKRDS